jgi:hypothetical protein
MTRFFLSAETARDPRSHFSLPMGQNPPIRGEAVDYDAILYDAIRNTRCAECGSELPHYARLGSGMTRSAFCSEQHFYRFRDRRRYAMNREAQLERSRRYYAEHRVEILEKAAAKRGRPKRTTCEECGAELTGRQRVACSPKCRDARYRRLHPQEYAAKEARKVERRREARRKEREA